MTTAPGTDVESRLTVVRERIAGAGGGDVRVVAVTKGFGAGVVEAALAAGLADIGENYANELLDKRAEVAELLDRADSEPGGADADATGDVRWHFLGRVQRNKVRRLAPFVALWQAVDRLAAGEEIARWAPGARVLVQVNVSGEPQKHGCAAGDAPRLVDGLRGLGLDVAGLMAVGATGGPEGSRGAFRAVSNLADQLHLAERSMGMTDDLEIAVEEGATMVRVGRALFGPRNLAPDLRR